MCQTITVTRPSSWVYGTERDYRTTLRGSVPEKSRENNRLFAVKRKCKPREMP